MAVDVKKFLTRVEEIAAEGPGYQHGHSGDDHLCDCIGLVIGAIRRAGGQWRGTHGTNYAARAEMKYLKPISTTGDLKVGEVVYKSYEPGVGGYNLPARYERGGDGYTGDMRDYYHIGVVISVNPLRIRHMTTPKPRMDTAIGKWSWHGWLKKISEGGSMKVTYQAKVIGGALNLRSGPSKSDERIDQIPDGTIVTVTEDLAGWSKVIFDGREGYVASMYLEEVKPDQDVDLTAVPKAELEAVYDMIGNWLGLRG